MFRNLSDLDFRKLNSMTKYPSILTYHEIGAKGVLKEAHTEGVTFAGHKIYNTEKIDGTNARIILFNGDYMLGTREEIIYAAGDRIRNPMYGIVETLHDIAEDMAKKVGDTELIVVYGEVYGGDLPASKKYTANKSTGFRVFDSFKLSVDMVADIMARPLDKIASWREHGGQPYLSESELIELCDFFDLLRVPFLEVRDGYTFPTSLADTYDFLQFYAETQAWLDVKGKAEGIVVRTEDRKIIRKIRFEDYERTKRNGGF